MSYKITWNMKDSAASHSVIAEYENTAQEMATMLWSQDDVTCIDISVVETGYIVLAIVNNEAWYGELLNLIGLKEINPNID